MLNDDERRRIEAALEELRLLARADDQQAIKAGIERLEQVCGFYVERRMNRSIQQAMSGHNVDEFE